ncbi:MAG TPA: GNAT family N-acetyltransferase [Pirellulales bacterium]|nr:GNAT family N-acetyltransferase [Pirellulales bacterium]
MQLIRLQSKDELLSAAGDLNELWRRSAVALPAARAEPLAAWLDQFAPRQAFQMLVVADAGRWAAALPLVDRRLKGLLPAACWPYSPWWTSGELLLDAEADQRAALDALAVELAQLQQPLMWLDAVRFTAPRWQALLRAVERAGLPASVRQQAVIGQVEIDHDWDEYQARWTKGHRRKMKVALRKADAAGGVRLSSYDRFSPGEVGSFVRAGFEIEHRSWKGGQRSSVLSQPGMLEYYVEQGQRLASAGCLRLSFLEHHGQQIAFEYGLTGKGTYYSYKVGYDERFADLTPGQLLRFELLQRFFADPACTLVDFAGPLCRATSAWSTRVEPVGRVVIGTASMRGRLLHGGYRFWRRQRQVLLSARREDTFSQPGVQPRLQHYSGPRA